MRLRMVWVVDLVTSYTAAAAMWIAYVVVWLGECAVSALTPSGREKG